MTRRQFCCFRSQRCIDMDIVYCCYIYMSSEAWGKGHRPNMPCAITPGINSPSRLQTIGGHARAKSTQVGPRAKRVPVCNQSSLSVWGLGREHSLWHGFSCVCVRYSCSLACILNPVASPARFSQTHSAHFATWLLAFIHIKTLGRAQSACVRNRRKEENAHTYLPGYSTCNRSFRQIFFVPSSAYGSVSSGSVQLNARPMVRCFAFMRPSDRLDRLVRGNRIGQGTTGGMTTSGCAYRQRKVLADAK
jgi:hypothetical protein